MGAEILDKVVYGILAAIVLQVLTNIVVVAVLKAEVKMLKDWIKELDAKGTRAHTRIDDINTFLRANHSP